MHRRASLSRHGWPSLFVSGGPFDDIIIDGKRLIPGLGSSAYICPGVGLGIAISRSRLVPGEIFLIAAQTLANQLSEVDRAKGRLYPSLGRIRKISLAVAKRTVEFVYDRGLAGAPRPKDIESYIRAQMYEPNYRDYIHP